MPARPQHRSYEPNDRVLRLRVGNRARMGPGEWRPRASVTGVLQGLLRLLVHAVINDSQDVFEQACATTLARYVTAGRRAGAKTRRPARGGPKAKAQGIDVKDRGRVPAELVVKFKAATEK